MTIQITPAVDVSELTWDTLRQKPLGHLHHYLCWVAHLSLQISIMYDPGFSLKDDALKKLEGRL